MAPPVRPDSSAHYDHTAQVCFDPAQSTEETNASTAAIPEESPPPDYHDDALKLKRIEQPREQGRPISEVNANGKLMTDSADQMSDPAKKLPRLRKTLADRHRWMDKLEKDFDADTNIAVRETSDWVSGAGEYREAFRENLQGANTALTNADLALEQGNWNDAYSSSQSAESHLDEASTSWSKYIDGTSSGARSITHGLRVVRNGSAAFVGAGATALIFGVGAVAAGASAASAGAHAGLLSIPFGAEPEPTVPEAYQQKATEPKPRDDVPKEKPVAEKPEVCIPPDQRTAKSADYKGEGCNPKVVDPAELKLERRIQWAVRERPIDPKTVKKDTAALVAEARQALTEWKQNPSATHKYGDFFLQTEAPDKMDQSQLGHLAELRKQWEGDAATYRATVAEAKPDEGTKAVMGRLFDDYLTLYVRKNANMSDVLDGRGGNCEAQTKLITAGMTSGEVKLPLGERLAVQLFEDHMQAVVYNQESGTVHNLLTGEETTQIRAPLYDPHIFHHAYLQSRGEESPVNVQDLLIADTNGDHVQDGWHPPFSTNSKLNYPGGKGYYNSGPVPEVAYVGRPGSLGEGAIGDGFESRSFNKAIAIEDLSDSDRKYSDLGSNRFRDSGGFISNYHHGLIFETKDQADFYNNLPDDNAKKHFLVALVNQGIASVLAEPGIQRGLRLLENPSTMKRSSAKSDERAIAAIKRAGSLINNATYNIQARHGAGYGYGSADEFQATREEIKADVSERNPLFRVLQEKRNLLIKRIQSKPLEFVLFMDRVPPKKRQQFMKLVKVVDYFEDRKVPPGGYGKDYLARVVANRRILGVGEKPGYKPQIIHITLVDGGGLPKFDPRKEKPAEGEAVLRNEEGQQGREKRKDELVDETNAPYRVKAESMIDFALEYAPKRWNHALAREFRQLNRDGRYDQDFLYHYHALNNSYPESQQRFEDPCFRLEYEGIGREHMMTEGKDEKVAYDIHLILADIVRRRQQANTGTK